MSKIMILTSEKTGNGHQSSAKALEKKLVELAPDTEVVKVNCFKHMGKMGEFMEECYIPMTTKHPYRWAFLYKFAGLFPHISNAYVGSLFKKGFLKLIKEEKPDAVVTNHPMHNAPPLKYLRKAGIETPYFVNVIDLVKPPRLWRNKRADALFLPTEEVKNDYIRRGFDRDKLIVSGFAIREDIVKPEIPKVHRTGEPLYILMVNPSGSPKKTLRFVTEALKTADSRVNLVCGRDENLYNAAERFIEGDEELKKVREEGRLELTGFITDMNERLKKAHILVGKAGPNMILEAARSGTATVVSAHIPGQEANNFRYVTENGFGIKCENPAKFGEALSFLTRNDSAELNKILKNTLSAPATDGAEIMAREILRRLGKL